MGPRRRLPRLAEGLTPAVAGKWFECGLIASKGDKTTEACQVHLPSPSLPTPLAPLATQPGADLRSHIRSSTRG